MGVVKLAAVATAAYVLGSVPVGYLVCRLWRVDVLGQGSGRTGGTNVFRSAGLLPALLTGALDVAKGALAVWLAGRLTCSAAAEVLAGGAVILGHNYSVFLGFRGGAGVGTSLGALGVFSLTLAMGLGALLFVVIRLTRYASVGSLTVTTLMPILLLILGLAGSLPLVYVCYGVLAWCLIVYAHRGNIRRLLDGSERRLGPSPANEKAAKP
jgi:acyl phosphate:glycerol-3-phosphate acyltransferase